MTGIKSICLITREGQKSQMMIIREHHQAIHQAQKDTVIMKKGKSQNTRRNTNQRNEL